MNKERITVAASTDVVDGKLFATQAAGRRLLLTRINGEVRAVENRCPHMGMKMTRGELSDGVIQCPWHGSRFDFCSGANLDWVNAFAGIPMPKWTHGVIAMGKNPTPLNVVATAEADGKVFILADT